MVTRHNGFHIPALPSTRNTKQVGLVSLTLFNVVVDNVIRTWLAMKVEDQRVAHNGLGETFWRCLGVFYSEHDVVVSCESDWMENTTSVIVGLFRRYSLATNIAKSRTMPFQPSALQAGMLEEAMVLKCTGVGY